MKGVISLSRTIIEDFERLLERMRVEEERTRKLMLTELRYDQRFRMFGKRDTLRHLIQTIELIFENNSETKND